MRINVKAFAFTCGIVCGLSLFGLTWWIIAFDGVTHQVTLIGRLYRGYNISPMGSVVGLVWGFFDALIGGAITAWLYNLLAARFCDNGNPADAAVPADGSQTRSTPKA